MYTLRRFRICLVLLLFLPLFCFVTRLTAGQEVNCIQLLLPHLTCSRFPLITGSSTFIQPEPPPNCRFVSSSGEPALIPAHHPVCLLSCLSLVLLPAHLPDTFCFFRFAFFNPCWNKDPFFVTAFWGPVLSILNSSNQPERWTPQMRSIRLKPTRDHFWEHTSKYCKVCPTAIRASPQQMAQLAASVQLLANTRDPRTLTQLQPSHMEVLVSDPEPLFSDLDKCWRFQLQCSLIFPIRPSSFASDTTKVNYVIRLMKVRPLA